MSSIGNQRDGQRKRDLGNRICGGVGMIDAVISIISEIVDFLSIYGYIKLQVTRKRNKENSNQYYDTLEPPDGTGSDMKLIPEIEFSMK